MNKFLRLLALLLALVTSWGSSAAVAQTTVPAGPSTLILYDAPANSEWSKLGLAYAIMLKNLMGHFNGNVDLRPVQNYTETDMAWWAPYAAHTFSGLYAIHGGKVYELLLDRTDPAALTVYLRVYGL